MSCRFCTWVCDRFCPPDKRSSAVWDAAQAWEERYATDWEPWEEGDELRGRWRQARDLEEDDPAASLAIHRELAEAGSPFSMLKAGWHYQYGRGVEADAAAAEDFYRRALCAGSWRGTIYYAKLLYERGAHDLWPSTLGDGVDKGFVVSSFWLGWYRYARSPRRRTAREVRPLLEAAAQAGHPGRSWCWRAGPRPGSSGCAGFPRGSACCARWCKRSLTAGVTPPLPRPRWPPGSSLRGANRMSAAPQPRGRCSGSQRAGRP